MLLAGESHTAGLLSFTRCLCGGSHQSKFQGGNGVVRGLASKKPPPSGRLWPRCGLLRILQAVQDAHHSRATARLMRAPLAELHDRCAGAQLAGSPARSGRSFLGMMWSMLSAPGSPQMWQGGRKRRTSATALRYSRLSSGLLMMTGLRGVACDAPSPRQPVEARRNPLIYGYRGPPCPDQGLCNREEGLHPGAEQSGGTLQATVVAPDLHQCRRLYGALHALVQCSCALLGALEATFPVALGTAGSGATESQ